MNFASALLQGDATCNRAVNLVGEPVFASYAFYLKHLLEVVFEFIILIFDFLEFVIDVVVGQNGLWSASEEVGEAQINRIHAVFADKSQTLVVGRFANHIIRCAFAFGCLADNLGILFIYKQSHAFLRLVSDYFLVGKGRVADWEVVDVDCAAALVDELAEAVEVTAGAVVVDRTHRVAVVFYHGADDVSHTFLHLRIGTLHGVELDGVGILACTHARDRGAAHSDAVVVAAQNDDEVAWLRVFLHAVVGRSKSDATREHNDLVVAVVVGFIVVFAMFEGEERAIDERLSELVSEVRCSVRSLDEQFFRGLIEPRTCLEVVFPLAALVVTRIASHINGCSC